METQCTAMSELLSQISFILLNPYYVVRFRDVDPAVLRTFKLLIPLTFDFASTMTLILSCRPVSGSFLKLNLGVNRGAIPGSHVCELGLAAIGRRVSAVDGEYRSYAAD